MKVIIDADKCEGSARCYNLYTDVFEKRPDGKGVVLRGGELETENQIVDAQSAANACPRGAIRLEN